MRIFTFNPIKKTELELKILNEKAAEAQEVVETAGDNAEAVKSALENYQKAHGRLEARLSALKETSENPNIDKLLNSLAEKVVKHEALFADLEEKFADKEEIKDMVEKAREKLDKVISEASRKEKDNLEKFSERLKKEAEKEDVDKEDLMKRAAHQIKEASEKMAELEKKIAEKTEVTESAKKLFEEAKTHLSKAVAAMKAKDYGEAFGQARSAEVLARNGMKVLERETESKDDSRDKDEGKGDDKKSPEPQAAPFPKPIPQNRPMPRDAEIKFETSVTVVIDENGFNPREIGIKKGGKVTWVNQSQNSVWPASNPHPIHTDYHGFDALRGLANGESYSFTFDKVGSWKYHNHLNPSMRGEVKVEE